MSEVNTRGGFCGCCRRAAARRRSRSDPLRGPAGREPAWRRRALLAGQRSGSAPHCARSTKLLRRRERVTHRVERLDGRACVGAARLVWTSARSRPVQCGEPSGTGRPRASCIRSAAAAGPDARARARGTRNAGLLTRLRIRRPRSARRAPVSCISAKSFVELLVVVGEAAAAQAQPVGRRGEQLRGTDVRRARAVAQVGRVERAGQQHGTDAPRTGMARCRHGGDRRARSAVESVRARRGAPGQQLAAPSRRRRACRATGRPQAT